MNSSATRPTPATPVSPAVAPQPPRLLDQVRAALASRQTPPAVINHYVSWIEAYIRFHQLQHPRELGAAEVQPFSLLPGRGPAAAPAVCSPGPASPGLSL